MKEKTVDITGGTSGIGEIAAEALAQMGARIVLVARNKSRMDATLVQLGRKAAMKRVAVEIANRGVTAVTARAEHSLALRSDGTVWACGWNQFGQLGDDSTTDRSTPVQVLNSNRTPFSGVTAIAAGGGYVLAKVETPLLFGEPPQLTLNKVLVHPNPSRLRLFNLQIDGVTVRANVNGGGTGPVEMSSGNYMVSETGGTNTDLSDFTAAFSGDCAADGSVTLVPGDKKTCTITNYDHAGGCSPQRPICCEPGSGQNGCYFSSICAPILPIVHPLPPATVCNGNK
jgi:hypothetical protein